jgi:hypothetical protein
MTSPQTSERSIFTAGTFIVRNHDGKQVEVRRELLMGENRDGEWFIVVAEPDEVEDECIGEVVAAESMTVPFEASKVFDHLFRLIADPTTVGTGTS